MDVLAKTPFTRVCLQGFIQALTDLRLPEVNLKLSLETQSFKPKNEKVTKTI